jgi:hypothetical protein
MIVTWKKNGLRLRVLDVFQGKFGESRLMVCKETCTNAIMGRFSVRTVDTSAEDLMVV